MVLYRSMLVEKPYPLDAIEDRDLVPGHDLESKCTYCGVDDGDPWYPIDDITVYRVWTAKSVYAPNATRKFEQGGTWQWRCPNHPKLAWAPHSHEAPDQLLPPAEHPCAEKDGLSGKKCGTLEGTRKFLEGWFCADHSTQYELLERARRLLSHEDPEAGVSGPIR